MRRRRILYLTATAAVTVIGLLSRRVAWLPAETGDALWAVMVFCLLRMVMPRCRLSLVALTALGISYLVEFSQLIRWPWLTTLRTTTLGHLLLGQGFLWIDLVAYTIGVAVVYLLAYWYEFHDLHVPRTKL